MLAKILQSIGYAVCHQIPSRSFTFFNESPCLCARCLGIYSTVGIILTYYFGIRVLIQKKRGSALYSRKMYFLLLFLMMWMPLDVFFQYMGIYFSNVTRFITGSIFGFGLSVFFISLISDRYFQKAHKEHPIPNKQLMVLGVIIVVLIGGVLTLNDYVILLANIIGSIGVIGTFICANLLIMGIIFKRKQPKLGILLLFCGIATGIEMSVLYYWHLSIQDLIVALYF